MIHPPRSFFSKPPIINVLSSEEALREMCYEIKFGTSACAKLFRKLLLSNDLFPIGKLYEDLATIYKLIGTAETIVFLDRVYYHYVQRHDSLTHNSWSDKVYDVMDAVEGLLEYTRRNYPAVYNDAVQRFFFSANEVYIRAFNEDNYIELIRDVQAGLKKKWHYICSNIKIDRTQKFRYWLMTFFPLLYRRIWKIYHGVNVCLGRKL